MAYGQDLLNKIRDNKSKTQNKRILEETEGSYVGAAIGGLVGLLIGYQRKGNLVISAFLGAAVGGLVSRAFIRRKDK